MDSLHVNCRNMLKTTWSDYQKLKTFLGADPDEETAIAMAFLMAREVVDPLIKTKILDEQPKPLPQDAGKDADNVVDKCADKYKYEAIDKKGPDPGTIGWAHDAIYGKYKEGMDIEYPKQYKEWMDTQVFKSLKGQPCGEVSNIMSSIFLGQNLSEWRTKDLFGKVHISDAEGAAELLGTVKRVPTWVFVRVEAGDFGHSFTYVGHPVDGSKLGKVQPIMGIIYQSNMHQSLGDAMFSLGFWCSSVKFEAEVDLEEHLAALRSYKTWDIDKVMEFVNKYYMADGLVAPEATKLSVLKAHGDKLKRSDIWLIIRPMSEVILEENYDRYVKKVAPWFKIVKQQLS